MDHFSDSNAEIAFICHEANRAYCLTHGDHSQPFWSNAPEWQRRSALEGVEHAMANPQITPQESHEGWLKAKEREGWVYGPEKDPEKKTHPCFLPYDELPAEQRRKDALFTAIVKSLA